LCSLCGCRDAEVALEFRTRASRLEAALRGVEWVSAPGMRDWCPWCACIEEQGHAPDCMRQKALEDSGEN
jgi:hypothetical protein